MEAWSCHQQGSSGLFMEDGSTYSASSDRSTDGTGYPGLSASASGSRKRKLPQQPSLREKLQLKRSASSQLSDSLCMSAIASPAASAGAFPQAAASNAGCSCPVAQHGFWQEAVAELGVQQSCSSSSFS